MTVNSSKGKVCILTTVHHPFDTRVFYKQASSLVEAGYEVSLITQSDKDKIVDGVNIISLPKPRNRLHRMIGITFQCFLCALKQKADIYHFHDPELIPIGIILRLLGKKVIYDVHEDVPQQVLDKYWIPKPLRFIIAKAVQIIECAGSRTFSAVITATPTISKRFIKYNKNTITVQNLPLLNEFDIASKNKPFRERKKAVAYIGGITKPRGIYEMVEAVRLVSSSVGACLVLGGNFRPGHLEGEIKNMPGWACVDYKGWLDRNQIAEILGDVRIGLIIIHPEPRFQVSYPVKLFEYMSAGLPVIASNFPLWREIVEGNNCGLTVDPLNPGEIAEAIQYLLDRPDLCEEMGRNGRQAVEEEYNWEKEKEKLLDIYDHLLK